MSVKKNNGIRCRTCREHANRIRPCRTCGRMTCYSCTIEAQCPDCWTYQQAMAFAAKDTQYFDDLKRKVTCEIR